MSARGHRYSVRPVNQGWWHKLSQEQRSRVDRAVIRALYVEDSTAATALRTGLSINVVHKLRARDCNVTELHLEKLAPLLGTTPADVLSGKWAP